LGKKKVFLFIKEEEEDEEDGEEQKMFNLKQLEEIRSKIGLKDGSSLTSFGKRMSLKYVQCLRFLSIQIVAILVFTLPRSN